MGGESFDTLELVLREKKAAEIIESAAKHLAGLEDYS
jgi:hypothetical protein